MGKPSGAGQQEVSEYRMSIHYGLGWEVDGIKKIKIGDKVAWEGSATAAEPIDINRPDLFGGAKKEGGAVGIAYFLPGRTDQVMPNALASRFGLTGATCPAFRGISSLFFVGSAESNMDSRNILGSSFAIPGADYLGGFYWTANSPFLQPVSVTAWRAPRGLDPATAMNGNDANPIHIIYECLTNSDWGMGAPTYHLNTANWTAAAAVVHEEAFGISLKWTSQMEIEQFVVEVLDHVQATFHVNPRNGLMEIKLLRNDYDLATLRTIHPGNARFKSFARKLWGETTNEISVTWTNPENEEEVSVTAHDLGNIAAQGSTVSDNRNYYGIRNADLAMRVAQRDVRMSSAPLAAVEAELDRSFWDILPGEVVKVDWPEKNLSGLVMRVIPPVGYGKRGDPGISVTLVEDVFSLERGADVVPPSTGWAGTAETAAAMSDVAIFTLPAFLAARERIAQNLAYPEVVAGILTYQPGTDTIAYNLYRQGLLSNGQTAWFDGGVKSILGRGEMLSPLYPEASNTVLGLPLIEMGRGPVVSGFVFIGDGSDANTEIALITAIDSVSGTWTIERGVLDTVPRSWPVGTLVWFVSPDAVISDDDEIRSAGEIVQYKLLTRTSLGQLALDSAPLHSGTMTARPHLPLRPANIKINGSGFGQIDANTGTGGAYASGTVTFATAAPTDGETVSVNGIVYTFRATPTLANDVALGTTPAEAAANLNAALVADAAGSNVVSTVAGAVVTIRATLAGAPGNAIALAETGVNITVSGATLSGGADATALPLSWANRNRLTEDGQVVKWTDLNVTPEYLQEILITVYRENGVEMFRVRGLWTETAYTIPIAWVQQEKKIFVRFSCEREGLQSLQNYGLWVQNIPQIPNPSPPPASPVVVGAAPSPPAPDPEPSPDPLPPADPVPPSVPAGGGGTREWRPKQQLV